MKSTSNRARGLTRLVASVVVLLAISQDLFAQIVYPPPPASQDQPMWKTMQDPQVVTPAPISQVYQAQQSVPQAPPQSGFELQPTPAGTTFRQPLANLFDPNGRTYYSLSTMQGQQFGGQQPYSGIGASHFIPMGVTGTLFNAQALVNNNGNPAGTFGAQQRWLVDLPVARMSILGAGAYMDFSQSRNNNLFQQVNINLEMFTESSWVARANGYLPFGQTQTGVGNSSTTGGAAGQVSLQGTTVFTGGISRQLMDAALTGIDLELGRKFFNYRAEAYAGYYNWTGSSVGSTNGVKGGVRAYLTDNLYGNVNISHDQFFGTGVYGGVAYTFGSVAGNRPTSFFNLMTLPAQRAQQVAVANYTREIDTLAAAHDKASGDILQAVFVSQSGTGVGTQSNPSNVNSVLGNSNFGNGSTLVLLNSNGNITSPVALNHDGQQVVGGGSTGVANIDFSQALGEAPGTSVLHLTDLGGRPVLAPTAGNAVTLTNQNVVQGFTIDGSGGITNGISGNPGANNTTINDMIIQHVSGTGININPSSNTIISNTTFTNNGQDIVLDASSSQISNITSTGATNGAISLGNGGNITGNTLISNVNITGAGGYGGILLNNAQNGSTTTLNNVTISGGAGAGVTVSNSQAGSIYNLTSVNIMNVGSNGISLQNSNGTFGVDASSSITNTGAAAFAINGGGINVNDGGSINQSNPQTAFSVIGDHTGTVIFGTGSSVTTTNGNGFQFTGADGTYRFLGTNNMNGGNAGINIVNSNGAFVFNNPTINNTAGGIGVSIVGSAGNVPVTTFNGLNITTNSNTGFFVSNAGLTTVNGISNVNASNGPAVDSNSTSLAAVFTNLTSDQSGSSGIRINNSSGIFGVTGVATLSNTTGSGIDIANSSGLTTTIQSAAINTTGSDGVTLSGAGTVSILGGTIDGSSGNGITSANTNLTATGINIGGTAAPTGDGISIVNNDGTSYTANLSNDTITGTTGGIVTTEAGAAKELVLTLDGDTLQSTGFGSLALSVTGSGANSTIIQSMNGGTILGNVNGGGVLFNQVTFDGSGAALSGTSVTGGNWTVGTTGNRIAGDGLHFNAPTGRLNFGTLNIANNNGAGLYVDTKTAGTTFTLGTTGGSVDTTNGQALFLDPLTTNMTLGTVSSTNSTTNGVTANAVGGTLNISSLNVSGAVDSGLSIVNSSGLTTTVQSVTINSTGSDGVKLNSAGTVSILGGTIDGSTGNGIMSTNSNLTASGLTIGGTTAPTGNGISVISNNGTNYTANLSNNTITGTTGGIVTTDSGVAKELVLTLDGDTLQSTGASSLALSVTGSGANSTIVRSMNGGTILGNGTDGGALFSHVTFDGSGAALSSTSVTGGDWTVGTTSNRIVGDGLHFDAPTGTLNFGNLNIANDSGTGLFVDTKTVGTTFTLGTTGGSVDTTNGQAMFLDPLTTNMTFGAVSSTNSSTNGVTVDTVGGTLNINSLNVSNAFDSGLSIVNSSGLTTTIQSVAINNTSSDGVSLNSAGTVSILGGTIDGSTGNGITSTNSNLTATGLTIGGISAPTGAGISITSNDGSTYTVNLSNDTITATTGGIVTADTGVAKELVLTLDGDTLQSTGASSTALSVIGSGLNSTIVQSMNGGTILGNGTGGGALFSQVTFDGSGAALSGTSVTAGDWTIGTTSNRIVGDGLHFDAPTGTLNFGNLNIANDSGTGLFVDTKTVGTTFTLGTTGGTVDTTNGIAMSLDPLTTNMTLDTVSSTNSSGNGVTIDTVGGTLNISNVNVSGALGAGLSIVNSSSLTTTVQSVTINNTGSDGITLTSAGTVSILGGTIDGSTGNGITSTNSNLTVSGLTIGATTAPTGDGIMVLSTDGTTYNVNLSNNTITGTTGGIATNDSGVANELVLTLDGNTLQSTGTNSLALSLNGNGANSTIVQSMNGGTILGNGTGGGAVFNQVTFDGSGAALTGTPVAGGDWTIGTTSNRIVGDGLRFNAPTGNLSFGNLNIANDSGTGLYVDTKTVGTTFTLGTTGGTVDTTNGQAMYLDPLTTNMTLDSVTSTNSTTNGVTINTVDGTLNITSLTVSGAMGDGFSIVNSSGLTTTIQTVSIDNIGSLGSGNGITLNDAGTVSILGGTIDGTTVDGINSTDTNLTATGLTLGGVSPINGNGITIINTTGSQSVTLSNDTITAAGTAITTTDSGNAGSLVLTLDGNTLQSISTLALSITGAGPNSTIIQSMNGGTILGNGLGGGASLNQVTFDGSGAALTGTSVTGGDWTIGTTSNRIAGDGLHFFAPTGNLNFGNLNIANNSGTGLYVDTKTLGTTFTLGNTGGTVDTTNGQALFLDPLSANMTFDSVTSTGSSTSGITLLGTTGTVTINGGSINSGTEGFAAISADNSALTGTDGLTLNLNNMTINGPTGSPGILVNGQSQATPIVLSLNSTSVIGGDGDSNYGGGAGIQPNNAVITLDANSSSMGGNGNSSTGGGAGVGGSGGGVLSFNAIDYGSGVSVLSDGIITGGNGAGTTSGGGAGVGGGGGTSLGGGINGGNGDNAIVSGAGTAIGGNGSSGGGGGAGVGGGGGFGNVNDGGTGTNASNTGTSVGGAPNGNTVGSGGN